MAQTALGFPFGFFTNDNLPQDAKYFNRVTKLPYEDIGEANTSIPQSIRHIGLTVNIDGVEYWWRDGVADGDLVIKTAAPPTASNLGSEGVSVYKELSNNDYKFKKLKSTDGSVIFTPDENSINITLTAVVIGSLKTFYVNSGYANTEGDADGSITRPFPNFNLARIAYMGTSTDILSPQYKGSKIILQTNSETATAPTMNGLVLEFENNAILTDTTNNPYMFSTEVLYGLAPKTSGTDDLEVDITITLTGKGGIKRGGLASTQTGLIQGIGSNRNNTGTTAGKICTIYVGKSEDDEITLYERAEYPSTTWNGNIVSPSGVPLINIYGYEHKYSTTLAPTTPLMYIEHEAKVPNNWGVTMEGTVNFITLVNSAIKIVGNTTGSNTLLLYANKLNFLVYGQYIATVPDTIGGNTATAMPGYPGYYRPRPDRYMIEMDRANLYCNELKVDGAGGYQTTGVNSFFRLLNNASLARVSFQISSNYYMEYFLDYINILNSQTGYILNNTIKDSNISVPSARYFLSNGIATTMTLVMPRTTVQGFTDTMNTTFYPARPLTITTGGTMSSFRSVPAMSGIQTHPNEAAARTAGLPTNSLYIRGGTDLAAGVLDIVNN